MITSKHRGHEITYIGNDWYYKHRNEKVVFVRDKVPCIHCEKIPTVFGEDACIGSLIGVMNACCGHGEEEEAYIQFLDEETIRGKDAIIIMNVLKKYK